MKRPLNSAQTHSKCAGEHMSTGSVDGYFCHERSRFTDRSHPVLVGGTADTDEALLQSDSLQLFCLTGASLPLKLSVVSNIFRSSGHPKAPRKHRSRALSRNSRDLSDQLLPVDMFICAEVFPQFATARPSVQPIKCC